MPALNALHGAGWQIPLVITQPPRPKGRGQAVVKTPVHQLAKSLKLEVKTFDTLKTREAEIAIAGQEADLCVVVSYGVIVPRSVLKLARLGYLNIHPSLLPKYRGSSPIQTALLNGELVTGVTLMIMDDQMDHGPIIKQEELRIGDDNFMKLHDRLANLGAEMLTHYLLPWVMGKISSTPQNDKRATFTKLLQKDNGKINWKKPAESIERQVRALNPWPGTWTTFESKLLKILSTSEMQGRFHLSPGEIKIQNDKLVIGCANNTALEAITLQLEGKSLIKAKDFIHGHKFITGVILL